MQVTRVFLALCLAVLCIISSAHAQWSHVDFSAGGGSSEPAGHAGSNVNTGYNLDFRGGYKPTPHLALDVDCNYNRWNLNTAALARYGEPNGYSTIWSFSFLPAIHGSPHWHVAPYAEAGPGIYYQNLTLTQPAPVNTIFCDPFFGFCYPAPFGVNQVVASATTYKMGVNAGAGLEMRSGQSYVKAFGEARYSRMFTTHGSDLEFVPVTFGIRW